MSTRFRIGLVNGCWDLFHDGHARFLWEASKQCTYLIVGVNTDESVRQLKGPTRPFDLLHYRMDRVSRYADQVVSFNGDVEGLIASVGPDVVIRGWDQTCSDVPPDIDILLLPRYGDISTTRIENERQERPRD